jgi:polysaccharide export outer membrane protein
MYNNKLISNAFAALIFIFLSGLTVAAEKDAYTLHQGDVIQVSVWGEEKLQSPNLVLPDGSITYPLAGVVEVVGLTAPQVEAKVADKLKPYLPDPQVSVVITGIEGNKIHIIGKVKTPGEVLMNAPMTVLKALSVAGGFAKFADKSGIKILRETAAGRKVIPVANYEQLVKGESLDGNYSLVAGDTILVP